MFFKIEMKKIIKQINFMSSLKIYLPLYLILSISYYRFIIPQFGYYGYFLDFSWPKFFVSLLVLFILIKISLLIEKPYAYISYTFFLIFSMLPLSILFSFSNENSVFYALNIFPYITIALVSSIQDRIHIVNFKIREKVTFNALFLLSIAIFFYLFISFGLPSLNYDLFLFENVYETRTIYKDQNSGISAYFISWLKRIILPIIILYGLKKHSLTHVFFATAGLVYIYLLTGIRSVYVSTFYIYIAFFIYSKRIAIQEVNHVSLILTANRMWKGLSILLFLFFFINLVYSGSNLVSLFIRRVFFSPAHLGFYYYDFFSKNDFIYWSNSVLEGILPYEYDLTPSLLIGEIYANNSSANNGFVSDGYMNSGVFGVLLYSIMLSISIKIVEDLKVDFFYFPVFFLILWAFLSSPFFTVMLTHGMLLFIIIFIVTFKDEESANPSSRRFKKFSK